MYLRKATTEDCDLLFTWANDPAVRQNAFSTESIPYEVHEKWFQEKMQDKDTVIFILMEENAPVGQIRFDIDGTKAQIDYSIAEAYRGKGYGKQLLLLGEAELRKQFPQVKKIIAEVKKENNPSKQAFLKNAFVETYTVYEKPI